VLLFIISLRAQEGIAMEKAREFWLTGVCPYCESALSLFTETPDIILIYRCHGCNRGLTIIVAPLNRVLIEAGTTKQRDGSMMAMPAEKSRFNA
jgi:hypothetical protein